MAKDPAQNKDRLTDLAILIFALIVQALLVAQVVINLMEMLE
jgi:hypothetical protein